MTKFLNITRQHGALFSPKSQDKDVFEFTIPNDEVFHSCRLTILDTHFDGSAQVTSQPSTGQGRKGEIVVTWQCQGMAEVKYQLEAFSRPIIPEAGSEPVTLQRTRFKPSLHGWHFNNSFEQVPPNKIIGDLKYGDASKGLCGGMVFAALDYFIAGLDLPQIPEKDLSARYRSPLHGPIFEYLGKRLFNSFDVPIGVWNYIELMHPDFPDSQTSRGIPGMAPRSRAWRMVRQEWPIIKSKLDAGHPCPLGLVRIISTKLSELGNNHQVLAYGYDLVGDDLTLMIYDPNNKDKDNLTLKVNIGNLESKLNLTFWDNEPVHCFFHTNYMFSMPPDIKTIPGRIILFEDENFCGKSIDIVREDQDLRAHKAGNFDNRTSSFVILSGKWNFYLEPGYEVPVVENGKPLVLGAGRYSRVVDLSIQDNEITSLRAVNTRVVRRRPR